jgi:hypothetical protein
LCDGGIRSACTEPQIVTFVAKTTGKPAFFICGIITEPIDAVSATDEPEMHRTACSRARSRARDRRGSRRRRCARGLMSLAAMPPSAMMPPASTKNGIASSAKSSVPVGDLEHDRFERDARPDRAGDRAEAERVGDRHAERAEEREGAQQDDGIHGYSSSAAWSLYMIRGPWRIADPDPLD